MTLSYILITYFWVTAHKVRNTVIRCFGLVFIMSFVTVVFEETRIDQRCQIHLVLKAESEP